MDFLKQAEKFANSDGAASGGGGDFMSAASNLLKSQGAAPPGDGSAAPPAVDGSAAPPAVDGSAAPPAGDGSAAPPAGGGNTPGSRAPPTNAELMKSGQLLMGAAQGQKVDQSQLAGAASDLLGGLAAHGNLDQGAYGSYINQAEEYLDKYAAKGQSQGQSAAGAGPEVPAKPTGQ